MAKQLIADMSGQWSADQFRDSFRDEIMKLVETKAKAGDTETVTKLEEAPSSHTGAEVIDLTELLKRSLQGKGAAATSKPAAKKSAKPAKVSAKATPAKSAARKAAPAKARVRRVA